MRISIKQLLLILIIAVLPLPLFATWLSISEGEAIQIGLLAAQVSCAGCLFLTFKQTQSRSLRLFWLYLCFAIICALFSDLLSVKTPNISQLLTDSFLALFVYFFIFLAIETNPHLSNIPLNKFISGRVPAIFFTVICFSYFVLLPMEFANSLVDAQKPALLFHILISAFITTKLIWCFLYCRGHTWQITFALLSLAAGTYLTKHLVIFNGL